jgi:hypothetical protein
MLARLPNSYDPAQKSPQTTSDAGEGSQGRHCGLLRRTGSPTRLGLSSRRLRPGRRRTLAHGPPPDPPPAPVRRSPGSKAAGSTSPSTELNGRCFLDYRSAVQNPEPPKIRPTGRLARVQLRDVDDPRREEAAYPEGSIPQHQSGQHKTGRNGAGQGGLPTSARTSLPTLF